MQCPNCTEGRIIRRKVPYYYHNLYFGDFSADVCPKCGEIYFTEEASDAIDARAMELGVWGIRPPSPTPIRGLPNEMQYFSFPMAIIQTFSDTKETPVEDITV